MALHVSACPITVRGQRMTGLARGQHRRRTWFEALNEPLHGMMRILTRARFLSAVSNKAPWPGTQAALSPFSTAWRLVFPLQASRQAR
jgi:hypothetical protein